MLKRTYRDFNIVSSSPKFTCENTGSNGTTSPIVSKYFKFLIQRNISRYKVKYFRGLKNYPNIINLKS